jgi:NADH-quinone oxidoreductase subunit G
MEFLLINHPLDCPVCDQGGECPLQDQALGYGGHGSRYYENKRSVPSHDIGPLVATEMTRCIHCTRCVRFGEEVAGAMEMGAPGRGENLKISTFLNRSVDSEVSGNMIDLCPVGALTSRPYRFAARSWEMQNHAGISPHDCLGTNINIQTLRDEVERVLPIENPDINECWLADRDRFSYEAVNSEHRLTRPMIKKGNKWKEVEWETALKHAAAGLKSIINSGNASAIGGLVSATSTLEEFYLLQKLLRGMGSESVDHRLQQCDFRDDDIAPLFPASEAAIKEYSELASVMLVGSNIRKEQPLLSLRIREGWSKGNTTISAINPVAYDFNFDLHSVELAAGNDLVARFAALAKAVANANNAALPAQLDDLADSTDMGVAAAQISGAGEKGVIVLGATAQQHPNASLIKAIGHWIAETTGNRLAILAPGNSAAAAIASCQPGEDGKNAAAMMEDGMRGFVLLGSEPELDCIDGKTALAAMHNADFVVQLSPFRSESVMQYADVLLPMAAFAEAAGTYVNCEGRHQPARVAASPKGEARPAWKILRVLGNFLECDGFDYISLDDVMAEIASRVDLDGLVPSARLGEFRISDLDGSAAVDNELVRIAEMPMYRGDMTLRHASALQDTADNPAPAAVVNPDTMQALGLEDGEDVSVRNGAGSARLPVRASDRVPAGSVTIPAGFHETTDLGGHVRVTLTRPDSPEQG